MGGALFVFLIINLRRARPVREKLEALKNEAIQEAEQADTLQDLQSVKVKYLGKKGPITEVLRGMGKLSAEERPVIGQLANDVRGAIGEQLELRKAQLEEEAVQLKLAQETIDVTLP